MYQELLGFLKTKRVGVIATMMSDGSPHAATVHFAHREDPLGFIFLTGKTSKKAQFLSNSQTSNASFVIGSDESEMKTLQLDGVVSGEKDSELSDIYFTKFGEERRNALGPDSVFITFTPTWWRYTDWNKPEGKTILNADGSIEIP